MKKWGNDSSVWIEHESKTPLKDKCDICGGEVRKTQVYKKVAGGVVHKGCNDNKIK